MVTDRVTKVLLGVIAITLFMIAMNQWVQPVPVMAQGSASFDCTGQLKANAFGGIESMVGGYRITLNCR